MNPRIAVICSELRRGPSTDGYRGKGISMDATLPTIISDLTDANTLHEVDNKP